MHGGQAVPLKLGKSRSAIFELSFVVVMLCHDLCVMHKPDASHACDLAREVVLCWNSQSCLFRAEMVVYGSMHLRIEPEYL